MCVDGQYLLGARGDLSVQEARERPHFRVHVENSDAGVRFRTDLGGTRYLHASSADTCAAGLVWLPETGHRACMQVLRVRPSILLAPLVVTPTRIGPYSGTS